MNKLILKPWSYLKIGDAVDVIAPASHSPKKILLEGEAWIKSLGLVPRIPHNLITPDVFFAAPLKQQWDHLRECLYSDSKLIWCLRGGYGSMRLIPYLEKLRPPKKPKLFIGFSDITALHIYFNQKWNWPTIHGRTLSQMEPSLARTADRQELRKIIFGQTPSKIFKNLTPLNQAAQISERIDGKIIGGNLRILQSSIGTSWEFSPKGKMLFIEDIGERGYSVDRMLEQLFQARLIDKGLKALIIGDFHGGEEKDGSDLTDHALKQFAQRVKYPVFKGLPCGHGREKNHALPFNTSATLTVGKKVELAVHFGGHDKR